MQAVLVACDISKLSLKLVPSKLISQATERLRDKKACAVESFCSLKDIIQNSWQLKVFFQVSVRKRALQKLIEVYHDYCKKCCEGSMTVCDHYEEIPCKIMMLCYDKDCKEFRSAYALWIARWIKIRVLLSDINVFLEFQITEHGICSCRWFISGGSFCWGKDKALDTHVFSFQLSSRKGTEYYFDSKEKVLIPTCLCGQDETGY